MSIFYFKPICSVLEGHHVMLLIEIGNVWHLPLDRSKYVAYYSQLLNFLY